MGEEFRMLGMTIPRIAILNGSLLTIWGVFAYFAQSSDSPSITALIPAFMGLPMLLLGLVSEWNPSNKHHYMHACMVLALIMALGGARVVTGFDDMSWLAIISHLLLLQIGISFTVMGIKSFRYTRLQRESLVIE
ncbi:MAG: hypothetical protein L7R66_03145 [Candidatus Thalassarchaeaceae archaeon]|nr:hypothetical protein [Candidatus Thalassarchaeaceae archaeon]